MPVKRLLGSELTPEQAKSLALGKNVVAVDPGADGATAARLEAGSCPWLCSVGNFDDAFDCVDVSAGVVLLLEDQFIGKGAFASLEVTWQAGAVAGWFMHAAHDLTIVHVKPSTWQARQRDRLGVTESRKRAKLPARVDRKEGIRIALAELVAHAPLEMGIGNKKTREGKASALGILRWFEDLCSTVQPTQQAAKRRR